LKRSNALVASFSNSILQELTFNTYERKAVSWLEFWMYMCNKNDEIDLIFDHNELLVYTKEAH